MIKVFNINKQHLLTLTSSDVRNNHDDVIAYVRNNSLVNLQNQVIASAEGNAVINSQKQEILFVENGEILGNTKDVIGYVEGDDQVIAVLGAAAYYLFFLNDSWSALF